MVEEPVDHLIRVESNLTRSFVGSVCAQLATIVWAFYVADRSAAGKLQPSVAAGVLLLLQLGFYVWYAVSAGAAAKALGESGAKYVAWILAAPFLALLPIPIVSTLIGISPLSIKFLLGNQLQTAIRESASLRSA
jgi:hypothetical protein